MEEGPRTTYAPLLLLAAGSTIPVASNFILLTPLHKIRRLRTGSTIADKFGH
jgi:hypothetical protein